MIVGRLYERISGYSRANSVGFAFSSQADISWSQDTLVQPDVFVADLGEVRTLEWKRVKTLALVVEALSPRTARSDRFAKRHLYQSVGVPVYWIVDPDRELVEVWTPSDTQPAVHKEQLVWTPGGAKEPLTIEVAELFREV